MAHRDQLLSTIEAVYAAGLDADRWEDALAEIAAAAGGVACSLEAIDRRTMEHSQFRAHGLPSALELAYLSQYAAVNPRWKLVVRQKAGELGWDYRILGEEEMERSPFYEDFLARVGFRYFSYGMLTATRDEFSGIAVHRTRRQGHAERADIERLALLVPHVRNAFDLSRRVAAAGAASRSLEQMADWLSDGVALTGPRGEIVHGNRAFQTMANRQDGVLIRDRRLRFAAAPAQRLLDRSLARVARLRAGAPIDSAAPDFIAARPSGAPPYVVSVRPILDAGGVDTRAAAMVLIHDPLSGHGTALLVLRDAFGLTEAEADLAQVLQSGLSPGDYAREKGLSLNTVYTHLRHLKEKMGVTRMAGLVSKLAAMKSPVRRS